MTPIARTIVKASTNSTIEAKKDGKIEGQTTAIIPFGWTTFSLRSYTMTLSLTDDNRLDKRLTLITY
jgi:hypothetical protein